jgi:hypothetical protein
MTDAPKRRGRRPFEPTDEQRKNVKIPVGLGMLEEHICALVRDYRDRPIGPDTLRKYFRKEIEIGAAELNAQVGNFMIATPFTDLFARSRLSSGLGHLVRSHLTG